MSREPSPNMQRPLGPKSAAVATPHPAAASAGREILLAGGNAVDAAVAAMLTCCVAMPGSVGVGGYGGTMVAYLADPGRAVAIDFDSRAPLAYREDIFGGEWKKYDVGYLSITVPAVVAGLSMAMERYGTKPWAEVSKPAITLAEQGIPISADLKRQLDNWAKKADAISLRALFPAGAVPDIGKIWKQQAMAGLLRRISSEGPGAFYHGEIPRTIVRQVREHGGILAEQDFEHYRPKEVAPTGINYRGYHVLTPPPPAGGVTSLQILKVLEQFDLRKMRPWGAEYFHLVGEAAKLSWQDRAKYLGDPDVTPIPVDALLSETTARAKAERIRRGGVVTAGQVSPPSPPHTVNVLTSDAAGNMVSLTATQGYLYGSAVVIEGLGLVMGHGMSRFDLAEGSPNRPAPGKRMYHNMSPTLVLRPDGGAYAAVGLPGGPKIVTVTAQLVANLIDFGASPAEAVKSGRVHAEADEPLAVSSAVPDSVIDELRALGHTVRRGQDVGGPPDEIGGKANVILVNAERGTVQAASQAGEDAAVVVDSISRPPAAGN
jgi:gamma-glutamyltranspeptidase/glutathione hydrolase